MSKKDSVHKQSGVAHHPPGFPMIRTCLIFFGIVLICNLLEWLVLKPGLVEPFQIWTAKVTAALLNGSGLSTQLRGTEIFFQGAHWEVVAECTALRAMYVFVAFIIAYPSSLRAKGIGTVIGLPLLMLANFTRLFTLAWVIQFFPTIAEMAHDYVWQIAFLFLLVLMWLIWIDLVVNREKISAVHF